MRRGWVGESQGVTDIVDGFNYDEFFFWKCLVCKKKNNIMKEPFEIRLRVDKKING